MWIIGVSWVAASLLVGLSWPHFDKWMEERAWRKEVRALQAKRVKR